MATKQATTNRWMILTFLNTIIINLSQQIQRPWASQAIRLIIRMCTRLRAASLDQEKLKAQREGMAALAGTAEALVQSPRIQAPVLIKKWAVATTRVAART